jgi:hypothetical protein
VTLIVVQRLAICSAHQTLHYIIFVRELNRLLIQKHTMLKFTFDNSFFNESLHHGITIFGLRTWDRGYFIFQRSKEFVLYQKLTQIRILWDTDLPVRERVVQFRPRRTKAAKRELCLLILLITFFFADISIVV